MKEENIIQELERLKGITGLFCGCDDCTKNEKKIMFLESKLKN